MDKDVNPSEISSKLSSAGYTPRPYMNELLYYLLKCKEFNINLSTEEFDYLIKNNDLNFYTNTGWSPLMLFLDNNENNLFKATAKQIDYLIKNTDLYVNSKQGNSALDLALNRNLSSKLNLSNEQFEYIIKRVNLKVAKNNGWDALMIALDVNKSKNVNLTPEQLSYLIRNSDLYHRTTKGWTALTLAFNKNKANNLNLSNSDFDYLIKNSDLNIINLDLDWCPLDFAQNNNVRENLNLNSEQFDYLIKKTNLKRTGINNNINSVHLSLNTNLVSTLPISTQSWEYFIKKSTLNLDHLPLILVNTLLHDTFKDFSDDTWSYIFDNSSIKDDVIVKNKRYPIKDFILNSYEGNLRDKLLLKYENAERENYSPEIKSFKSKMQSIVGLNRVKEDLNGVINTLQFNQIHAKKIEIPRKYIFVGNHGTGKQMIAKALSVLYKSLSLISNSEITSLFNDFFKNNRDMSSELGRTIYYHFDTNSKYSDIDVELQMIDMIEMTNNNSLFILGISQDDLQIFRVKYPKVFSLFPKIIYFDDYSPEELYKITENLANEQELKISSSAQNQLIRYYELCQKDSSELYSNFYIAKNTFNKIIENHALSNKESETIDKDVIDISSIPEIDDDNISISEIFKELNDMVGLDDVKYSLIQYAALVLANKRRGNDFHTNMHLVFLGNPGTGKTVVARLVGKIYKATGLLKKGHVIETDRSGLVAGYVGHTALKTKEIVKKSMGGVLFIDEAYSLVSQKRAEWDFGKEAIDTLLKLMEDHRKDFAVIVAGYPAEMENFIKSNPGLQSRFTKKITFKDYTMEELISILQVMCKKENFTYNEEFIEEAKNFILNKNGIKSTSTIGFLNDFEGNENKELTSNKFFGNAREVRTLFEKVLETQSIRLMNNPDDDLWTLTKEDIQNIRKE